MTFVYLDIETTGLDPDVHQVWELAYAVGDDAISVGRLEHDLRFADPAALRIGRYWDRRDPLMRAGDRFEFDAHEALSGATLVAANPAFDTAFLYRRWNTMPWHYRLLDIEVYAMPALGLDTPKGLAFIADQLGVEAPDHTAAGDVAALRSCHRKLQAHYADLGGVTYITKEAS